MRSRYISYSFGSKIETGDHSGRDRAVLLIADFILRFVGTACFTILIAGVYTVTGSTSSIGLINLATVGPSFIVLLFSGTYMQFLSPMGMVRWLQVARGIVLLAAVAIADHFIGLFIAAALQSLVHQTSVSAKMVLDAEYLSESNRVSYNAKKTFLRNIATIAGPAIGGASVSFWGIRPSLIAMAFLSVLVALILSQVRKPGSYHRIRESHRVSALSSIRHLATIPEIAVVITVYCMVCVILAAQAPLMFPFVHEVYSLGSGYAGLLLGLCGVGGMLGAFIAHRFPDMLTESTMGWLVVADGVVFFVFTQIHQTVAAALACTLLGVMGAVTLIIVESTVQRSVGTKHRPFTFSIMQFAGGAGGASVGVAMAFLAQVHGARYVLGSSALVEMIAGIAAASAVWFGSINRRKGTSS